MSLGKKDIVNNIFSETHLSKKDLNIFLDTFIKLIKENTENKTVKISKFGSFNSKSTPQRVGRNPKTKEQYLISKRKKVFFKPSYDIKNLLNWYIGRDGRIWTDDHYTPSVVRYQNALHPEINNI